MDNGLEQLQLAALLSEAEIGVCPKCNHGSALYSVVPLKTGYAFHYACASCHGAYVMLLDRKQSPLHLPHSAKLPRKGN